MVGAKIGVQKRSNTASMLARLDRMEKQEVYVGVTQPKAGRTDTKEPINNAQLAFIHTMGSPLRGIPARPIIQPAILANRVPILAELRLAAQATLTGEFTAASAHLRRAGLMGQNFVRAWFTDPRNGWAPNKPSTIKAKGSDRPLIDTAQLRKAMTYVVKEK